MTELGLPDVHRSAFFAGELLTSHDLDDVFTGQTALRALHNRALHGWGVALGLGVAGPGAATSVTVGAGYAIDGGGADLILVSDVTLPVPAVSAGPDSGSVAFALTISRTSDDDADVESRDGPCGAAGAVRRSDAPAVRWRRPADVRESLDVVLATAKVRNCALVEPVATTERHSALAPARPHVASGASPAGRTRWRLWPDTARPAGVSATVATAEGGFGDTPRYYARLDGDRTDTALTLTGDSFLLDGASHVDAATARSFEFIVTLPTGLAAAAHGAVAGALTLNPPEVLTESYAVEIGERLGWHVVWMGVEG